MLDEVDILFGDDEFEQVLQSFVSSAPMSAQYLFVTATLPVDIYSKLVEVFPDCEVIMGPGMHRTSSGLEEVSFQLFSFFPILFPYNGMQDSKRWMLILFSRPTTLKDLVQVLNIQVTDC